MPPTWIFQHCPLPQLTYQRENTQISRRRHHLPSAATLLSPPFSAGAMLLSFNHYIHQLTPTQNHTSSSIHHFRCHFPNLSLPSKPYRKFTLPLSSYSLTTDTPIHEIQEDPEETGFEFLTERETDIFSFDGSFELADLKRFKSPTVEVKELEELPEQWRRSRLAWLCKELPAHRSSTFTRVLNAQRKWIRQEDCTYITVHCLRIRVNDAAFRVYKWMAQQHWFQFDFALATKLADYVGKERKYLKCREVFDDIINQGLIPNESTFHVLIVAYLSSPASDCVEEACSIYNLMIHLGGYKPRLSLHNSLFRALVTKTGGSCKHHLKQAEFIFHNLKTCGLRIHNDIYGGLIWLHTYQDVIDKERIASLRSEMKSLGIEERLEVLVSVLRACAKEGDLSEAQSTWTKILAYNNKLPTQAFVYLMEVYSKVGEPMKSLEIFREMQEKNVGAYYKIIDIVCKAEETELAECLMADFINSGMKPLMKSFIDIMNMYSKLSMHDKLESTFFKCLEKCCPNRTVYGMYLDSLVQIGKLDKAEDIFNQMHGDEAIGVGTKSCNTILRGYLTNRHYVKAKNIYSFMCERKYEVDSTLMEKIEYVMSLNQEEVEKSSSVNLSREQREILIGLLLSGLRVEPDPEKKSYAIRFLFRENSKIHSFLKRHIYKKFCEWLAYKLVNDDEEEDIPFQFTTISHSYFKFYADQFWPQGQHAIPKLIHRWLTPRVLAYWYMYGGYRTSSGDVLLKLNFAKEDAMRIVKTLKANSLDCRIKQKGKVFWIGFLGCSATKFWELTKPFVLVDLKELLAPAGVDSRNGTSGIKEVNFNGESDSDGNTSDYSDVANKFNLF